MTDVNREAMKLDAERGRKLYAETGKYQDFERFAFDACVIKGYVGNDGAAK